MMATWDLASQTVGGEPIPASLISSSICVTYWPIRRIASLEMKGYIFNLSAEYMSTKAPYQEHALDDSGGRLNY